MVTLTAALSCSALAQPLDRPIVGAVFFYWYEWDEPSEWGNWLGGVHNTPLFGYYDSRKVQDNFRSVLLAADWGITHLFIDYWGHDWRGENNEPRETTVLKAVEKVRSLGYKVFIGYYQDGTNFAMRDFWRNISERRDTYRWLRDYARSPAWTWLFGKPFQMVYARNGMPELTVDHEGFQEWLKQRYGTIDELNAEWGTRFRDFSEIRMNFSTIGFQRAMSIAYQYERWQRDWEKLEQLVRDELGLPGLKVSFDVGYTPFRNFGFERFARVFGGPHSYAGIFGQPHEQDAERFLQTAVAKKCGTVFFDHLKHRYADWNIRVPGIAYPSQLPASPVPCHTFDRFWVGNLLRRTDGVLHLSWNEWWEGSNLEPSFEGGKHFCEANLLYSTIWQLTYRDGGRETRDGEIGLLVNDWIFEHGGGDASDLYNAVQGLRAVNAPFEIVLQSEATLEKLRRYRVLVAPAGGVGFGFNAKGERIDEVLRTWLQLGERTLITSQGGARDRGQGTSKAGQSRSSASRVPRPAPRPFNFFVDIGVSGDEAVLVQGFSGREDWGKLPEGAFGAGSKATVRWIPGAGNVTVMLLPTNLAVVDQQGNSQSSRSAELPTSRLAEKLARQKPRPPVDLLLRWHGSAIWRNRIRILVNGQFVGEVEVEPGWRLYETRIPAEVIGTAKVMEVRFEFAETHIPGDKEPQKFPGEQRVCNLALDWVQVCTQDVPVGERVGVKWQPQEKAEFIKPLKGTFRAPLHRRSVVVPEGKPLSLYDDGIVRDLFSEIPSSRAPRPSSRLFVNGIFTDDPRWWATILEQVCKVPCGKLAQLANGNLPDRPEIMSAVLTAGTTKFLLVENRTGQPQKLLLQIPSEPNLPVSEIFALSRDSIRFASLPTLRIPFTDTIYSHAVYQVVFAPIRLVTPQWVAFPGQRTKLPVVVQNITDKPVTVTLKIGAVIASIKGEPIKVKLQPKERKAVGLPVEVKPFADWGVKTVFVEGTWDTGQGTRKAENKAVWLRPLIVGRNAQIRCLTTAITSHTPMITLINEPTTPFGDVFWHHPAKEVPGETAKDVEIVVSGLPSGKPITLKVGDLREGERKQIRLPLPFSLSPAPCPLSLIIRWQDSAGRHERTANLSATLLPKDLPKTFPDQVATLVIADAEASQGLPLSVALPSSVRGETFVVRLPDGTPLPTYTEKVKSSAGTSSSLRVHFVVPPPLPSLRIDIGSEQDEHVLLKGFSHRETWADGRTIRWLPGEGRETVLRLKCKPNQPHRLLLNGQAFWANSVSVFVGGQKIGDFTIRQGTQTLVIPLPPFSQETVDVRLVFHQAHVPAEKLPNSTDKRVCNFALDWLALEPDLSGRPLLLALCRAQKEEIPMPFRVERSNGFVRVDNGALVMEWHEEAGGTVTKFLSKVTGRDYAVQSFGAGIGVFGKFDPERLATDTAHFVVDDFVWQHEGKGSIRIVEVNPVWATVEVKAEIERGTGQGSRSSKFEATQRYRIFANTKLVELTATAKPLKVAPQSQATRSDDELVLLCARFNARWWTKSFPNFVGLGDRPPEVYGQHIVHFGWRIGDWLPPILCLFNPNDLTEALSLLVKEFADLSAWQESRLPISASRPTELPISQPHEIWVRQGFWGEQRGKPATERRYATIEIAVKPPRPAQLRLWLWLHEGHHLHARTTRHKLLYPQNLTAVEVR
jgi:hypothetical protein